MSKRTRIGGHVFLVTILASWPVAAQSVGAAVFGADLCPSGCSLADKDGDGISDDYDACPAEPETVNGFQDGDGCPDVKEAEMVEMAGRVFFDSGRHVLTRQAQLVLGELAPRLTQLDMTVGTLELVGRADARGDAAKNVKLSERRANAVRDWLIKHGVAEDRILSVGAGALPGDDDETMAANRRVELRAQLERRRGLSSGATIEDVNLQGNWSVRRVPDSGRSEIVSPDQVGYLVYAAVRTNERLALYGRNARGREADLILARRPDEPLRATVRERGAVTIGATSGAPILRQVTVGEAGAPPLVPFPPPPRKCIDCTNGAPVLIMHKPTSLPQPSPVSVQFGVMGGDTAIGPRKYGVRIHYQHDALSQPKHWDVWDAKPRSLEYLQDSNNVVRLELIAAGGRPVAHAVNPSLVEFTTDGNPCRPGTALIRGGDFAWVDTRGEIDLPNQASRMHDFCVDERMVSVSAYGKCVAAAACELPGEGDECTPAAGAQSDFVRCVTPKMAEAYCRSLGGRLPTEEQWEAAAHAASDGRYRPADPDGEPPPRNGFFDIGADGAWEWTISPFAEIPGGATAEGDVAIRRGRRRDGSDLRFYRRGQDPAGSQSSPIGFRCVY
jgi:outer membrane protein OmpA-like peptidoglycan-associated protein